MRLGFDAKRAFHNFRGLGNYSRTILENVSNYFPDEEYYLFTPLIKDVRALQWNRSHPQLKVVTPASITSNVFSSAWRSLFLGNVLKDYKLDIYHGLSHEIPPGLKNASFKKVVTIHDLIFLRHPEFFPAMDRLVYMKKFKYSCDTADIVVAICEQTKQDLIEILKVKEDKIVVVYQSCSSLFKEKLTQEEAMDISGQYGLSRNFILYVGAMEERKNALNLLKAYHLSKSDKKLVLIGRGKSYLKKIKEYISTYNLKNKVFILESVPVEDLPAFYQSASIFCYPSHFEGFGIPIIESLFSGTPVITSKGGCFPEAGGPGAIYINPNDIEELAHEISRLAQDEVLARDLILKGRKYVSKFEGEVTARELMKVYRLLCS